MKFLTLLGCVALTGLTLAQVPEEGGPGEASIIRSCKVKNRIAFTIDDGPTMYTPQLLEALKNAGITATFYINAANLLRDEFGNPTPGVYQYLKDIYEAGHEIGSHTYNHACLTYECTNNNPGMKVMDTKEAFAEQIINNENVIYEAIGKYPATYRAPFGDGMNPGFVNATLKQWLYEYGYPYAIHWDIETQDMENQADPNNCLLVAQNHYNGEVGQKDTLITLQHAIPPTIEKIIPWVHDVWMPAHPEMKFVKVSECLGLTDDDVYKTTQGPKTDFKQPSETPTEDNDNKSDAKTIFNGLMGSVILILFTALLNYF